MHICWCRHNYNLGQRKEKQALPRQADQLATLNLARSRRQSRQSKTCCYTKRKQVGFYMWLIFIKYRWRFISISVNSMLINSYVIPMVTHSSQFRMLSSPSRALLLLTSSLSSFHCIGVSRSQAHIDILPFVQVQTNRRGHVLSESGCDISAHSDTLLSPNLLIKADILISKCSS